MGIKRLLKRQRRASKPHIAGLQEALAEEGLQTQVRGARPARRAHFDGIAGKLTVGALDRYQQRNGLRQTHGLLDPVTVAMLGLPPMGRHIFTTPSGPQCPVDSELESEIAPSCGGLADGRPLAFYHLLPSGAGSLPDWSDRLLVEAEIAEVSSMPAEPMRQPGVIID